ncbi:MAG: carboxypeptidase regulatory-like domain-containing protein [Gammaproteobacteria bacterium]|nr:carboxypeptidase regulatory-like domain-containing protein [Gammaproteobacteria bacterium]
MNPQRGKFSSCCLLLLLFSAVALADSESAPVDETSQHDSSNSEQDKSDIKKNTESENDKQDSAGLSSTGKNSADKTAVLQVNVAQKGENGRPIKGATVIVTYKSGAEYERKTDALGSAMLPGLPYGKVDVDVTSSGRKSDGGSLILDESSVTLTFQLVPRVRARE